jgi:hypothetical protein
MNLRKMHAHFAGAMDAGDSLSIDDGKLQLRRKQLVDATVCCASVDKRRQAVCRQGWRWINSARFVAGIEADIDAERWSVRDEQVAT